MRTLVFPVAFAVLYISLSSYESSALKAQVTPTLTLEEIFQGEDIELKAGARAACGEEDIRFLIAHHGLNYHSDMHEEDDYAISYFSRFDGEYLTIAAILTTYDTFRKCLVDFGYPSFSLEPVTNAGSFSSHISRMAFQEHCTSERDFFDKLDQQTQIYRHVGNFDISDGEFFSAEFSTFRVYYKDFWEDGFKTETFMISYEIYGEFRDFQTESYWVCLMGEGYRSRLTDKGVREFGWLLPWIWVFHNPILSH